jgi:hypothetical protein
MAIPGENRDTEGRKPIDSKGATNQRRKNRAARFPGAAPQKAALKKMAPMKGPFS